MTCPACGAERPPLKWKVVVDREQAARLAAEIFGPKRDERPPT